MNYFKKGNILPTTTRNLSFRVTGWDSKTENDYSDILRYPREVLGETEIDGVLYIQFDEKGYTGSSPYIVEEKELMRALGIQENKETITLKQNILSLTEGTISEPLKDGKYSFGHISFTEKYVTDNPSIFKINPTKLAVGDYVQLLNTDRVCNGIIGEIGTILAVPIEDDSIYDTTLRYCNFYKDNLRKLSIAEAIEASTVEIEDYTAEGTSDGIKFGCNVHSIQDLNSYMHFLDMNKTATMTVQGVSVTREMLNKLIIIHNLK